MLLAFFYVYIHCFDWHKYRLHGLKENISEF